MNLLEKKELFETKKNELEELLASPDIINSPLRYPKIAKEHSSVVKILSLFESYEKCLQNLKGNETLISETPETMTRISWNL